MKSARLLLVEDNADDEALMVRALHRAEPKAQFLVARDGQRALEMLFGTSANGDGPFCPDVVLLDLNLPVLDGLEVLRRLRAHDLFGRTPVVLLSSSRREEDVRGAYAVGANAYVQKSVDFDQFASDVRIIVTMWLGLNEIPPVGGNSTSSTSPPAP